MAKIGNTRRQRNTGVIVLNNKLAWVRGARRRQGASGDHLEIAGYLVLNHRLVVLRCLAKKGNSRRQGNTGVIVLGNKLV